MTTSVKGVTRPGRPPGPSPATTEAVLRAALALVLTEGASSLTPQRLHQETGVSRSTVYRHWPTPHAVLQALIEVAPEPPPVPTGDLRADLHAAVDALCDRLRDKPVAAFLRALVAAADADPDAAELRHRYVEDLLEPFRSVLRDLPAGRRDEVLAVVAAPLLVDALLLDRRPNRARAHRLADGALPLD